jgi:hypothetical protein
VLVLNGPKLSRKYVLCCNNCGFAPKLFRLPSIPDNDWPIPALHTSMVPEVILVCVQDHRAHSLLNPFGCNPNPSSLNPRSGASYNPTILFRAQPWANLGSAKRPDRAGSRSG